MPQSFEIVEIFREVLIVDLHETKLDNVLKKTDYTIMRYLTAILENFEPMRSADIDVITPK